MGILDKWRRHIRGGSNTPRAVDQADLSWGKIWTPPPWASSLSEGIPWPDSGDLERAFAAWIGRPPELLRLSLDRGMKPGNSAAYDHEHKSGIHLNQETWDQLQELFRSRRSNRLNRLLHLLIHEAIHCVSPATLEFANRGPGLLNPEYIDAEVFEEGLANAISLAVLNRWLYHDGDSRHILSSPPDGVDNIREAETTFIRRLVGHPGPQNHKLRSLWEGYGMKARQEVVRAILVPKVEKIAKAAFRPDRTEEVRVNSVPLLWKRFYPHDGPLPSPSGLPDVFKNLFTEALQQTRQSRGAWLVNTFGGLVRASGVQSPQRQRGDNPCQ